MNIHPPPPISVLAPALESGVFYLCSYSNFIFFYIFVSWTGNGLLLCCYLNAYYIGHSKTVSLLYNINVVKYKPRVSMFHLNLHITYTSASQLASQPTNYKHFDLQSYEVWGLESVAFIF